MATTSSQLQRGFIKACSAVGPVCLSSLVARVDEIVSGEGIRRISSTGLSEASSTASASDTVLEGRQAWKIEKKRSNYLECNSVRTIKCEESRHEEIREAAPSFQYETLKVNGFLGVTSQGFSSSRGLRYMSADASEHEGIVVKEENAGLIFLDKTDQPGASEEPEQDSLYSSAEGPTHFSAADVNRYFTLSSEDVDTYFGEGLPPGLSKEFEETRERSFLIRGRVLELFDRFKRCHADTVHAKDQGGRMRSVASKHKPQCLLDGFIKCGKSAALAMLVHWARAQGWLVFYVPSGRDWTSGGMYYKNEQTGLYDTPVQAKVALEGFLRSHGSLLATIPCRVLKPLQLGEGAGVGKLRGAQELTLPEGASLRALVEKGIAVSQASVSVVLRIREELSLVQQAPVLLCIDEFNSWFTFSHFHEATGTRSRRPIHAREVSMVNAFRTMEGPIMMATAFSQSLAVGKLPVQLPGVPKNVRFPIPRYTVEEATAAMTYYHSRKITSKEPSSEDIRKLFYLTNGNGEEIRTLARLLG
ncbi:hypothetical protein Mapa_004522 [Marchantia paleacea]|nr:hypothetical protein Mapa_004522 [Marchantia paleacea]